MKIYLFAALLSLAPATAHAAFFLNKKALQSCSLEQVGEKRVASAIAENCVIPEINKECKASRGSVWANCPRSLISQLGRWVKLEHAAVRKAGGKRAENANRLMSNIGDGKSICQAEMANRNTSSRFEFESCRVVVLGQAFGMLHIMSQGK